MALPKSAPSQPSLQQSSQIAERIRKRMELLSESARKIAEFVLASPEDVALLPAARVAERLGVSESTVTRFAVLLGYKGYPSFRRDLQSDLRRHLAPLHRLELDVPRSGGRGHATAEIFRQDIENIMRTERSLSREALDSAADLISNASRIYVVGLRASFGLGHALYFQLNQLLGNVVLMDGGRGEGLDQLLGLCAQDLLISVSFPRHAALTVAALEFAKTKNARIISISDSPLSPTAVHADVHFSVSTSVLDVATSFAGAYALIGAISSEVRVRNHRRVSRNLTDVEHALSMGQIHHRTRKGAG